MLPGHSKNDVQEYYSAIKRNEIKSFAITWMELETTILREVTQEWKNQTSYVLTCKWELAYKDAETQECYSSLWGLRGQVGRRVGHARLHIGHSVHCSGHGCTPLKNLFVTKHHLFPQNLLKLKKKFKLSPIVFLPLLLLSLLTCLLLLFLFQ